MSALEFVASVIVVELIIVAVLQLSLFVHAVYRSHVALHHFLLKAPHIHLTVGGVIVAGGLIASCIVAGQVKHVAADGQTPSNPLPFDLPSQASLKASGKKVFAHYFTPYPISIDNVDGNSDYYATQYLTQNGEGGAHAAYGGLLRERPLIRGVDSSPSWQLDDMKTEVSRATAAGLDGFFVDMLDLDSTHWNRLNLLLQAAPAVDSNFKIALMPDGNSSVVSNVNTLASKIASIANSSAVYKLNDGRLVVAPFDPEVQGASWWNNFVNIMHNTYGITVAFVPCFLNYPANAAAFAPFSYGFSNWGNRSPAENTDLASNITDAHNRGKIWMQPVSLQDERPDQQIYDEANNTENLRVTWAAAQGGADWVQLPTWNDYSEGAEIAPSTHTGYSPLDLTSYNLTKFKTGSAPAITRDVIYVSHRVQPYAAHPTGGETQLMQLNQFSSPARDTVEVLSFLTAPSTITVKVGANTYSYAAPAGVSSQTYPLAAGAVYASVSRGGNLVTDVTSPFTITNSPVVQDLQYHFVSSGREGKVYSQPASSGGAPSSSGGTSSAGGSSTSTGTSGTSTPSQNGTVSQGSQVIIDPATADPSKANLIAKVEFYEGTKLLQTVTAAPFTFDTSKLTSGTHTITQKTYYKDGKVTQASKSITIKGSSTSKNNAQASSVDTQQSHNKLVPFVIGGGVAGLLAAGAGIWWWFLHPRGYTLRWLVGLLGHSD